MPENFWREDDSLNELEPISLLMSELSDLEEPEEVDSSLYRGIAGRRRKAAVALTIVWSSTIALHIFSWGYWTVLCLTTLMSLHALRVLFARPLPVPKPLSSSKLEDYPFVSLLVAAKNEEAVITTLVKALCSLDYPTERYDLWVIDDNSSDRTPVLLDRLAKDYQQLQVVHRSAEAGGGKSGALNQVLPLTRGEILAVFDADAQVSKDLLRRVVPLFNQKQVGAVQVRKAIANAEVNFWTRSQVAEMAVDSYIQQQRIAIGGIGELRGNGQFVRRAALERCGGWNEQTITDDLDLTLRLHLDHWDIDFLAFPAVGEEGVTRAIGLWHQRNRWAEGGYQRYLDYWRLIVRNRLGFRKSTDLFLFWISQYILPTAAVPDVLMAIARNRPPMLAPMTSVTFSLFFIGMVTGLRRFQNRDCNQEPFSLETTPFADDDSNQPLPLLTDSPLPPRWVTLLQTLRGTFYMFHWIVVIAATTARISVRPKRLKWIKTIHHGSDEVWLDVSEQP
jgi:1,2-diacylglycerol 3-beta-glucosyltransferase